LSKTWPTGTRARIVVLFIAVLFAHVLVAVAVGTRGWDDGAITAAFANTYAQTGRMSLTPHSEVVEGFSSPFWLFLLAATYRLIPLDFNGMILASQLWAAFFAALGAAILFDLLRPLLPRTALPLSFAVFLSAVFLTETADGMEMTALSAVVMATVWLIKQPAPRWSALFLFAALVPWVRPEAGGYYIAAAITMAVLSRDYRGARTLVAGVLLSLIILSGLRLAIFHSVVPNTMLAKRWAPYPKGFSIAEQISESPIVVKELIFMLAPAVIVLAAGLLGKRIPSLGPGWNRVRSRTVQPVIAFSLGYLTAVIGFNLAIGPNGPNGPEVFPRMEQSVLALAVVAVVYSSPQTIGSLQSPTRLAAVMSALLIVMYFALTEQHSVPGWHVDDDTTPAVMRQQGQTFDELRGRLGRSTASVLTPDVGGASLCCGELEILDLGLLANHELAQNGYAALGRLLENTQPDIVQTHADWSTASGIYDLSYFRLNYTPIVTNGMWLYLRNDHLARLVNECRPISPQAAVKTEFRGAAVDEDYIRTLGEKDICELN
jgi:hypothetical protein